MGEEERLYFCGGIRYEIGAELSLMAEARQGVGSVELGFEVASDR